MGQSEPGGDRRGPRADELTLTPLVLIERIAALVVNSIALIMHSADIGQMLNHIGVQAEPQNISPPRGPPLWEDCDAQAREGGQIEQDWAIDWDGARQPTPDYKVDQRVNW